ncbi:MAG: aspartate carbamoyltransferase catalytic subunit [Gammaproteobacteria bacterium]|nr:aspartate carbamoyltransferase catalytic subunit [Gammaproteobacteria bacterium]
MTPPGQVRHLLSLDDLEPAQFHALLDSAEQFLKTGRPLVGPLQGRIVASIFFEPSTRTRVSFEIAARRLGADLVNLDVMCSSRKKGEADRDTLSTLAAMGASIFILRTGVAGLPAELAGHLAPDCGLISAGEAEFAHPTQGLLDMLTIRQHKPDTDKLRVAIVGDIAHSRVARSAVRGLRLMGISDIRLIGPESFLPDDGEMPGTFQGNDLASGIDGADVVMALRIQRERMKLAEMPESADYFQRFGLTEKKLAALAPDAIVMHPGPINRGIELDDEVADGPRSVIREQVRNGVAVRMAVLTTVANSLAESDRAGRA